MQRLLAYVLSVLFLCMGTGVAVPAHVCRGKVVLAAYDPPAHANARCPRCGMHAKQAKKRCCRDTHHILKSQAALAVGKAMPACPALAPVLLPAPQACCPAAPLALLERLPVREWRHGPPPHMQTVRLHVLHQVFLI